MMSYDKDQVFLQAVLRFRCSLLILGFLMFYSGLSAQNIIPNGSFENVNSFEYDFPFSAFAYLNDWRAASFQSNDASLLTTPDLFIDGTPIPATSPPTFWNIVTGASDGRNYVGLTNIATQDGAFLPETIAATLNEQLEPGSYYALSLDYRNKGRDNIHPSPMMCIEEELKKLIFYFDDEPVVVSIDQFANTSTPSTNQSIELRTASMERYEVSAWERIGTCFQAVGNEKYMALSMTTGRVSVYPPCVILDEYFDIFLHYYFDIDNLRLEKIPTSFSIETSVCEGRPISINLKDSIELTNLLNTTYFSFNGEETNDFIEIGSSGEYLAYAHTDCTTIPIRITVVEEDCNPAHYAPNAFSPNFDGFNDHWQLYMKPGISVTAYKLIIYDRWGGVVFETLDMSEGWSGNTRNKLAAAGTYTWSLQYQFMHPELGLIPQADSGSLLLIR